jgi:hypothetical protein
MIWQNFMKNPQSILIKKYLYEFLKDKYMENEKVIDRLSEQLSYKEDADNFLKLANDLFTSGFNLAIEQQKEELSKIGIKLNITNSNKPEDKKNKIF